ncbi:MAG: alpha/beta hydrolase [Bacteroidales bacterium]|nr:alpha/beta hydrolase [Bacteroidales bacterium]
MNKFLEKVGVSIASRIGITAAIALIAAAVLGGGYWYVTSRAPRETVKSAESGTKVDVEEMAFYGTGSLRVSGKVYRPANTLDEKRPAVIYCQDTSYGESWCRELAGAGIIAYCFDFQGDGEKARTRELETVLKGIRNLRHADKDRVFLLGEANGCLTAATVAFANPKQVQGLILVSPGFNPLEISRKAKRYKGTVLIVDDALGRKANLEEIRGFVY